MGRHIHAFRFVAIQVSVRTGRAFLFETASQLLWRTMAFIPLLCYTVCEMAEEVTPKQLRAYASKIQHMGLLTTSRERFFFGIASIPILIELYPTFSSLLSSTLLAKPEFACCFLAKLSLPLPSQLLMIKFGLHPPHDSARCIHTPFIRSCSTSVCACCPVQQEKQSSR